MTQDPENQTGMPVRPRRRRTWRPGRARGTAAALICLIWLAVIAGTITRLRRADALIVAAAGFAATALTSAVSFWSERARWSGPVSEITHFLMTVRRGERARVPGNLPAGLAPMVLELMAVLKLARKHADGPRRAGNFAPEGPPFSSSRSSMTRSGLYDAPPIDVSGPPDSQLSGDYSTIDMVNRLEPVGWHWIESSPAEQGFLGWTLDHLRAKSFLEIVHPEDRDRAEATFHQALERGEALGLIVRIRTAQGEPRAIEINAGARYGTNHMVTHLRCHLTDVTEKTRAERQLRVRTLELTRVNEQLRRINRELEELKDRYTDLYENAPAMYFSLDPDGCMVECNQTMLAILCCQREDLIGRPFRRLLPETASDSFRAGFAECLRQGTIETEAQWVKTDGEIIDVWIHGKLIDGPKGSVSHVRFVAQDVTARRRLETELQQKNRRLAETIEELSRKNRELDEFVYVVSHDLQEPLRTLIAFSDFLMKDYGDRLDHEGREYVQYLVGAARRMRSMIQGMLNLSRAGEVTGEFQEVDLEALVEVVRSDLGELIRSKGAEVRIAGRLAKVWGDGDRIRRLLANLIANGIKYNRSPVPWVEIGTIPRGDPQPGAGNDGVEPGDDVTIVVKDNGIGIEAQFHKTIFQLFRRLHTQEECEGTGAGLAICSKIVQAHGGRIWVESTPGEGSTFFIQLPCPAVFPSATSSSPDQSETSTRTSQVDLGEHGPI